MRGHTWRSATLVLREGLLVPLGGLFSVFGAVSGAVEWPDFLVSNFLHLSNVLNSLKDFLLIGIVCFDTVI